MDKSKRHLAWWVVGLLAVAAIVAWWLLRPAGVPEGFAVSNGRIEATEVDIASKIAGRIDTILVKEGQFVREGEVLAKMDTRVLQEQRLEAIAQIKEAQSAVAAAQALLEQRQSETRAAQSLVNQRQAELDSVAKRHTRSRSLAHRGAISAQQLDDDRAAAESARAALESAKAQVSASKAAIEAARTNIIQAQTRVEARLILDAAPDLRIPATISFVASVAQFTPKTVETSDERLKLMFRVKARIPPELLQQHLEYVKTGLPGVAWVRVNEELPWPDDLVVRLPQ
ncbi:auxiliary transport protein, membrane fusion protein (MFP) family [Escherichia coli O139:H28 str. E24377A]|uniref:Auxiliary transport protein, membrane fusion protein (MFP) family n=1 Tax=Escherichia coli O139:H28 (strain E24377A / ETEC) TaxID=331111 RepID=A7ZT23_ECO24|nr:biotin/lipoyl-binding protein [Escherichia coli]ABV16571.1 auxiliary transport protein, membrane fusion protein (MFP) family [Escherichia coli O139:H28 str. E24377A]